MPVHPQAQGMIDAFSKGASLDYATLTATAFRAGFEIPAPAIRVPAVATIKERTIEGPAGQLRVRMYYPDGDGPFPITLYLHGGGFVIGNPEMTDGICQALAGRANSLVLSPDYRLAPEAPFPAGLQDCWTALNWAHDHADVIGGRRDRIAVAGDSSGGNFAAALAQMARARGPDLCHQLLLYPVLDHAFDTPSYRAFERGYFLTAEMMRWYWRQYLPTSDDGKDWHASPLRQPTLEGLPPATIVTAEYDVLRAEAESYAVRLIEAGVPTRVTRWAGQIHGFLLQQGVIDDADTALADAADALKMGLSMAR
jgi:acetyl esterase